MPNDYVDSKVEVPNLDNYLTEKRSTFNVRRGMIFGAPLTAVSSILLSGINQPVRAESPNLMFEPFLNSKPDLLLEQLEDSVKPIKDFELGRDTFTGAYELIELNDPDKITFASTTRPLHYSYPKSDFHVESGNGTAIICGNKPIGPKYGLNAIYCPQHALEYISMDSAYPLFSVSGYDTLGYAFPDLKSDNLSEDVAECLLVVDKKIVQEDANYIEPNLVYFSEEDTFSSLVGKKLLLSGFPGFFDNSQEYYTRITFDINLSEIERHVDNEDVRYLFKFKPLNPLIQGSVLPGVSGGAVGYVDENGKPNIIATLYGYFEGGYWLGSSLIKSKAKEFINGDYSALSGTVFRPTAMALDLPEISNLELKDVKNINGLVWYLIRNSNYPIDDLRSMLHFQDQLSVYEMKIEKVSFWKKFPVIITKNKNGERNCYLWDQDKKKFFEFKG